MVVETSILKHLSFVYLSYTFFLTLVRLSTITSISLSLSPNTLRFHRNSYSISVIFLTIPIVGSNRIDSETISSRHPFVKVVHVLLTRKQSISIIVIIQTLSVSEKGFIVSNFIHIWRSRTDTSRRLTS